MKSRHLPLATSLAALSLALAFPGQADEAVAIEKKQARSARNNLYIVRMSQAPAVAYVGDIPGLRATKPARNKKIDPDHPDVVRYTGFLESRHDEKVARAGGRKVYSYKYSFNGFAAELSDAQAEALRTDPEVLSLEKDELRPLDTATTPTFLGLTAPNGLWSMGAAGKGEDIIVGIVDGGIWPEHPSFSDRTGTNGNGTQDGKLDYQQLPGWHGRCIPGDFFNASHCSQKVIGARYYNAGWGGNAGVMAQLPWEYNSPRDFGGHGTHTASTSAGNSGVMPDGPAAAFGAISGIAPRARIAVYKSCFQTPAGGSCWQTDSVAAIDQAVADGVDVINFSVGGSRTNFRDSVEIAFMYAADAGVFVATSAGNSGPTTATVAHGGPWVTTVAAGTHNRSGIGSITLGNGVTYAGRSLATAVGSTPMILSSAAGLAGADPTMVALCFAASNNGGNAVLDPAKVAGKIVVCDRGTNGRVEKSMAVLAAGGVGMVLANVVAGSTDADYHFVPTVHVDVPTGAAIKAYAAAAGATGSIAKGTPVLDLAAPLTASFSSRGPLAAGNGDLLKPDVMAPGQDILAAVAPPGNGGRSFEVYNGTSMSSPHVAGLAAVLKALHPDWTPMMVKSAMMTTATDTLDGPNTNSLVIFRQGAGHINPNAANNPGLVFNAGFADWMGFLCGTQLPTSFCSGSGIAVLDPSEYNSPSIAFGDLLATQTVTRRVTNVAGRSTYSATSNVPGFAVVITPATFTLNTGESQVVTMQFTRTSAALANYAGGQITWTDGTHRVRVPVVARPVAASVPAEVTGNGTPQTYAVKYGYTGAFPVVPLGLAAATTTAGSVKGSNGAEFDPATADGTVTKFTVNIPANQLFVRFSLFDANTTAGSDLDVWVANPAGTLIAASSTATSQETVTLTQPAAGAYTVYVHGFDTPGAAADFTLFQWNVPLAIVGNMTATATPAVVSGAGTVSLGFNSLTPGVKYMGAVLYQGSASSVFPTIVRVDP